MCDTGFPAFDDLDFEPGEMVYCLSKDGYKTRDREIWDKDCLLETFTNYTQPKSRDNRTIFGRAEKDLFYNYDDRLIQYDYERHKLAYAHANGEVPLEQPYHRTARWFEAYLTYYYEEPTEVRHIMAGCNRSNGYSYLVFGTRDRRGS